MFPGLAWTVDRDLRFTAGMGGFGPPPGWSEIVGRTLADIYGPSEQSSPALDAHLRALAGETVEYNRVVDGRELRVRVQPLIVDGQVEGVLGVASDLDAAPAARAAERRRIAQQEGVARLSLAALGDIEEDALLQLAVDLAADGLEADDASLAMLADDHTLVPRAFCNRRASPMPAFVPIVQVATDGTSVIFPDLRRDARLESPPFGLAGGSLIAVPIPAGSGAWGTLSVRADRPVAFSEIDLAFAGGLANALGAAFERRRLDAARAEVERRVHQSERLESLGQLAGGIAHDFNNLLAVILNYATFVAEEVSSNDALRADVEEIRIAAERAMALTRQLLIFAKRETVELRTLDLNEVVAEVRNLLTRSIGEHVDLVVHFAADLPPIRADRGQVEQVLLNLAINARDAMPDGGTLVIETEAAELDREFARLHPGVEPGRYVQLTVSDTGVGMSQAVVARAFEPFFTTKPKGKGTGLGLATIHGILTEAGGTVSLYSEEGIGSTFRVFLPAVGSSTGTTGPHPSGGSVSGQGETIIVVDDEPAILGVAARILRRHGYAVLEAPTPAAALSMATDHDFQLLITDSVMPQMSGLALAGHVRERRPGVSVLFMSGYSGDVLGPAYRVIDEGVDLLQKPFTEQTLLEKVHAALVAKGRAEGVSPPSAPHPD